jgi:cytochrome bd-type quinol oxidase subunit 2
MRRLLAKLVRHRVSQLGVVLTLASGCVFLGLVVLHLRGFRQNPYADIVVIVMLPALFALGLLFMVVGLWLQRRRERIRGVSEEAWPKIDLNVPETRRSLFFVMTATFVSLVALSFASLWRRHSLAHEPRQCRRVCRAR